MHDAGAEALRDGHDTDIGRVGRQPWPPLDPAADAATGADGRRQERVIGHEPGTTSPGRGRGSSVSGDLTSVLLAVRLAQEAGDIEVGVAVGRSLSDVGRRDRLALDGPGFCRLGLGLGWLAGRGHGEGCALDALPLDLGEQFAALLVERGLDPAGGLCRCGPDGRLWAAASRIEARWR